MPRRILFVHHSADLYGSSRMLLRCLEHVDRRRFEPLVVLPEDGPLKALIEAQGIEVFMHPRLSIITRPVFHSWRLILFFLNYPASVFHLWRLIRRRGISLVYTNTGVVLSPALAARLAGVPHIWHIREWFQEFPRSWGMFSWFIRNFSWRVVAISKAVAAQFRIRDKVLVVYDAFSMAQGPVSMATLREDFRDRRGLGGDFVVGCVGRIKFVRKGQEILVQATRLLKERGRSIRAVIVGAPFPGNESHLTDLRAMAAELGVEDRVIFTGEVADPRPAYAAMDLLAMTSVQPEPFGGVISEAMSVGLPVVATNHGGALDQVVDGVTGLLVSPGDPVALADAIERLLQDPALRQRMGVAARARAQQEFSLVQMTQRIGELLQAAIERRAPDPSLFGIAVPVEARTAALPRRVLHVHSSADIYGSGRSLLRLIQGMDRRRFQSLVVLPEDGRLRQLIEAQGVEVILHPRLSVITRQAFYSWRFLSPFLNYPFSVWFLWRLMRRRRIDLMHTNTGVILASPLAARLAGVAHVWHVREWFQEFPRLWFAYSRYIQFTSDAVVAVSSAIAAQFTRRNKVTIIHNGFSLEEFTMPREDIRADLRKRYGLNGAFVVGCVGRIKLVRKGQEVLVEATALLKRRGQPIRALIVGAPFPGNESHLARLRQLVVDRGVEDLVVFTGEMNDPRPAYAAMDVLALTSVQPEPFAGAVMEAMSMGLPVIATQVGGSLDQVVEGVTGLLVPPGDPEALADAIGKLMQDPEWCQRMSRAAMDRIRDQFSLTQMTRNIERLFDQTIGSTCRAPARP